MRVEACFLDPIASSKIVCVTVVPNSMVVVVVNTAGTPEVETPVIMVPSDA